MRTLEWKAKMGTHDRVGPRLMELREKYNISRMQLAKAIGCSYSAVYCIERGKTPLQKTNQRLGSIQLIDGILHALGLDMSALRDHSETPVIQLRQPTYRKTYLKEQALRDVPHSRRGRTLAEQLRAVG